MIHTLETTREKETEEAGEDHGVHAHIDRGAQREA